MDTAVLAKKEHSYRELQKQNRTKPPNTASSTMLSHLAWLKLLRDSCPGWLSRLGNANSCLCLENQMIKKFVLEEGNLSIVLVCIRGRSTMRMKQDCECRSEVSFLINQVRIFSRKMFFTLPISCLYLPQLGHGPDATFVSVLDDLLLIIGKERVPHSYYCVWYCWLMFLSYPGETAG